MSPTTSIYDVVVYPSCRRLPSILLAITAGTLVASVVVKHGSILTAGIVSVYAVQPPPLRFYNTLRRYAAQLMWSALQESDCSNAGTSVVAGAGTFHQDSVSAAVASLLVRAVLHVCIWLNVLE